MISVSSLIYFTTVLLYNINIAFAQKLSTILNNIFWNGDKYSAASGLHIQVLTCEAPLYYNIPMMLHVIARYFAH